MSVFKKAERKKVKLKIGVTGPSGSGKTYSALELATGLGQKIALADSENDSASLYSDRFNFDAMNLSPPYTVQKYIDAIKAAEGAKYDVLVIDSITHQWAGEGGLLSKKEDLDARGGNSYANWGSLTKEHEQFKAAILNADIHIICTIRSKQDHSIEAGEKGSKVKKLGMAPVQRDGMEYEFTTVFDIAMDHKAAISKDRTGLFDGLMFKITKETGEKLVAWLDGAKVEAPKPVLTVALPAAEEKKTDGYEPKKVSLKQIERLYAIQGKSEVNLELMKSWVIEMGLSSTKELDFVQYDKLVKRIQDYKAPAVSFTEDNIEF